MASTEKLENGATVLLEPVEQTGTVCIGFWFLHGSRDEEDSERGFSHFLEHMLFKGTSRRNAFQIAQEIDRVGGIINAFTEKEVTCYYCVLPREHIELAVDVLTDMIFHSTLDEREIGKEKTVVINEIKTGEDVPEERAHELYLRDMWDSHPLSRKITGEVGQVAEIKAADLQAFSRKRLAPSNMLVCVAGNFEPARILDIVKQTCGGNPPGACASLRQPPVSRRSLRYVRDKFSQVQIYTGTSYPLQQQLDHYYVALVFSTAFGESMSSRLFQQLREEKALCYTVYSFRTYYSDISLWTIYANTTPQLAERMLASLDHELARLRSDPPRKSEVDDAKNHLKGSLVLSKEDMEIRMKRLARQHMMMGTILSFDDSVRMLEAVTPGDIEEVIRLLVREREFNLIAYGSRGLRNLKSFQFSF